MNIYKLKLAGLCLGACTVIIPPLALKGAEGYISLYKSGAESLANVRHSALERVGLTEIKSDPTLDALIREASADYNLPPKLLTALVARESAHNSDAYSPKGAIGLAQIMPFNAARCGLEKKSKLWDDRNNVRCGARILSEELKAANGKLPVALMRYNGGPKCVNKCPESIKYAALVTDTFAQLSLQ